MKFVHLDMFHNQIEAEGLIIELVFSMVLNLCEIGTVHKYPFWCQKIPLVACMHGKS